MKVGEIMTRNPTFCDASSSVEEAAELMRRADVGILPVTEGPLNKKVVGVVTDRDMCKAVLALGQNPAYVFVRECMTRDPVCCHADDDVNRVVRIMAQRKIRRVPVIDDKGNINGMIGLGDLVRHHAISQPALFDLFEKLYQPAAVGKSMRVRRAA